MNPFAKSALTLLGVAVVVALFFGFRYAEVNGLLNSMTPVTPGQCRPIAPGFKGIADVEVVGCR